MIKKFFIGIIFTSLFLSISCFGEDIRIETMRELGIITAQSGEGVTRSEAVGAMARLFNIPESAGNPFADISAEDADLGYIASLYNKNIISGTREGLFEPDNGITAQEVCKIAVMLLGQDKKTGDGLKYPEDYMMLAERNKILRGINSFDTELSTEDFNKLLSNISKADMMVVTGATDGYNRFEEKGDVLGVCHGVFFGRGVVDENSRTGLKSTATESKENQIKIDGVTFYQEKNDFSSLLGMGVEYSYEETDGEKHVIFAHEYNNDIKAVKSKDILSFGDDGRIKAETENGNEYSISLKADVSVIYNGAYHPYFMTEYDKNTVCDYEFIDNDDDGKCDVIKVTCGEIYFVSRVNSITKTVYDEMSSDTVREAVLDDEMQYVVDGDAGDFYDITPSSVITVYRTYTGNCTQVIITNKYVKGKIDKIRNDKFWIAENEYKAAHSYKKTFELGQRGTFYLDNAGDVAGFKIGSNDYILGFLMGVQADNGIEGKVRMKILSEENRTEILECRPKITYNNQSAVKTTDVLKEIWNKALGYDKNRKLIMYKVNDSEVITEIKLSGLYTQPKDNELVKIFEKTGTNSLIYKKKARSFENKAFLNEDTVVFTVPVGSYEEKFYSVKNINMFTDGNKYIVDAYKVNESGFGADVIVRYIIMPYVSGTGNVFVLDEVGEALSGDEVVLLLYGLRGGKEVSICVDSDCNNMEDLTTLKRGDLLSIGSWTPDVVTDYIVLYQNENPTYTRYPLPDGENEFERQVTTTVGTVTEINTGYIKFVLDDGTERILDTTGIIIYIVPADDDNFVGKIGDVEIGSRIFVKTSYGAPSECVIYLNAE